MLYVAFIDIVGYESRDCVVRTLKNRLGYPHNNKKLCVILEDLHMLDLAKPSCGTCVIVHMLPSV